MTPTKFQLGFAGEDNSYLDTDCQVNPFVAGEVSGQDFLFISQGEAVGGLRGDKWCGNSAEDEIINSEFTSLLFVWLTIY